MKKVDLISPCFLALFSLSSCSSMFRTIASVSSARGRLDIVKHRRRKNRTEKMRGEGGMLEAKKKQVESEKKKKLKKKKTQQFSPSLSFPTLSPFPLFISGCSVSSPPRPWARGPPQSSPRSPGEASARFRCPRSRRQRRRRRSALAHQSRFPRRSDPLLLA